MALGTDRRLVNQNVGIVPPEDEGVAPGRQRPLVDIRRFAGGIRGNVHVVGDVIDAVDPAIHPVFRIIGIVLREPEPDVAHPLLGHREEGRGARRIVRRADHAPMVAGEGFVFTGFVRHTASGSRDGAAVGAKGPPGGAILKAAVDDVVAGGDTPRALRLVDLQGVPHEGNRLAVQVEVDRAPIRIRFEGDVILEHDDDVVVGDLIQVLRQGLELPVVREEGPHVFHAERPRAVIGVHLLVIVHPRPRLGVIFDERRHLAGKHIEAVGSRPKAQTILVGLVDGKDRRRELRPRDQERASREGARPQINRHRGAADECRVRPVEYPLETGEVEGRFKVRRVAELDLGGCQGAAPAVRVGRVGRVPLRHHRHGDVLRTGLIAQQAGGALLEHKGFDRGESAAIQMKCAANRHVAIRRRGGVPVEHQRGPLSHLNRAAAVGHVPRIDRGGRVGERVTARRHRGGGPVAALQVDRLRAADRGVASQRDVPHDERRILRHLRMVHDSAETVGAETGDCEVIKGRRG